MTHDSGNAAPATLDTAVVGCVFTSDQLLDTAAAALLARGLAATALHVGASDPARATAAAQRAGIAADLDADDPFAGLVGREDGARTLVDRGGITGGAVGALVGLAIGLSPGSAQHVPYAPPVWGDVALWFVLGAIVGTVLAAALAPQPSTHAAFRLIDGMQEGGYALVVVTAPSQSAHVRALLESLGGTGLSPG